VLSLELKPNNVVFIGPSMSVKVIKIENGEVFLETKSTAGLPVFSDALFAKRWLNEISQEEFDLEKMKPVNHFVCKINEAIRMREHDCIQVTRILNTYSVRLGFEAEGLRIMRQELLLKRNFADLNGKSYVSTNA